MEAENSLSKFRVSSLLVDSLTKRSLSSLLRCCFSKSFLPRLSLLGRGSFRSLITCSNVSSERLVGFGLTRGLSPLPLGLSNVNSAYLLALSQLKLSLLLRSPLGSGCWFTALVLWTRVRLEWLAGKSLDLESSSMKRSED